jgi:hypothetical protein
LRIRPIVLCLGLAATPGFALTAYAGYNVVVLRDVGANGYSEVSAINASGSSIGISATVPTCVECVVESADAVLWSPSGKATVLEDIGGQGFSAPYAINASGESVGWSATTSGGQFASNREAVLWSPSGKATVLQDVGGQGFSEAAAINASGESVGSSVATSSDTRIDAVPGKRGAGPKAMGGNYGDRPVFTFLCRRGMILFSGPRCDRPP